MHSDTRRRIVLSLFSAFPFLLASCSTTPMSPSHEQTASAAAPAILPGEGMWLYENPPVDRLKREFGFEPTTAWLDHLRLSSVHLGGASGSFVSPDGLILTNHHVALGGVHAISDAQHDYLKDGFLAASRDKEVKLPGYEARVLVSIEDVTRRVNDAVPPTLTGDDAVKARHAIMATIERESEAATKLESRVVTLYGGALYHLYRSKRYSDVRLVFAPELNTAFFGGDPDNFEYPRYCLDISLMRAYEDGHPAKVEHYLRWSPRGVSNDELTFVSGHPGRTDRLLPSAVLQRQRDEGLPLRKEMLERSEHVLLAYGEQSAETQRQAADELFGVQNSLKVVRPRLARLKGSDVIARKQAEEAELRKAIASRPNLASAKDAFGTIDRAEEAWSNLQLREAMLEGGGGFHSRLFGYARTLLRHPEEDALPDNERLPEFNQAKRKALEQRLFAVEPVYPELEIAKLTDSLLMLEEKLGASDETVKAVMAGQTPARRAEELVRGCRLADAAERRRLYDGGSAVLDSTDDAMIRLAKLIDNESRKLRKQMEADVNEPLTRAEAEVNKTRFAVYGSNTYPDATGSLRLAVGVVKGYDQDGHKMAPWTILAGSFEHEQAHQAKPPYQLPQRWHDAKSKLDLKTPLDFVATDDITGGNSGSPVVNRHGEFVGIVFDSNRQGIVNDYAYSDTQARMIAVDARGIVEALRKVYGADHVLEELRVK